MADDDRLRRRSFLKLAGASGVTVAGAGCASQQPEDGGDGDGEDGGSIESPTPPPGEDGGDGGSTEEPGDGGSTEGDEMVYLAPNALTSIDPAKMGGAPDYTAVLNFYDPFLYVEGGDAFRTVAHLATEWTTEDDGTTWVFTLRDDVTFQEGGTLTADDVVYSMDRVLRLQQGPAFLWQAVLEPGSVEARDDTTVAFNLDESFGPIFPSLVQLFVADSETAMENEADGEYGDRGDYAQDYLGKTPAGSGPYGLEEWTEGSQVTFGAYEDYWGGWADDQFEVARMKTVSEDTTAKIMMQNGEADLTSKFLSTPTYEEMAGYDNVEVMTRSQLFLWQFPMNTRKPPLDDRMVRKAISLAFDYASVTENVFVGGAIAAGPVPINMPGHNDDVAQSERDLDAAKAALDQASYSLDEINDIEMEVMYTSALPFERPISLILQDSLKQLGITNVTLSDTEWATMLERTAKEETTPHFTQVGNTAKILTPDSYTFGMYHPSTFGQINSCHRYSTEELTALLEEARATPDREQRFGKYEQAQELIVDGYPSLFMANPPYRAARNVNLGGWEYRGLLSYDHRFYDMFRKGDGRA